MNSELEALIKALDAYFDATGSEAHRLLLIYESRLDEAVSARPGLSKTSLHRAVESAYRRWRRTQNQPSTLPPRA